MLYRNAVILVISMAENALRGDRRSRRPAQKLAGDKRVMPATLILYGIRGGMCNLLKSDKSITPLVRSAKQVLYRAVRVLAAHLRLFGVRAGFVYGMGVAV